MGGVGEGESEGEGGSESVWEKKRERGGVLRELVP